MRNVMPELVERCCEVRDWSQRRLAEHLGVSEGTVSDWARGVSVPGPESREKLARSLTSVQAVRLPPVESFEGDTRALKHVAVEKCRECPYWDNLGICDGGGVARERPGEYADSIPEWCPLPELEVSDDPTRITHTDLSRWFMWGVGAGCAFSLFVYLMLDFLFVGGWL